MIHGFLDALGVPGERIPSSLEAVPPSTEACYRRRVLVVLDNAHDEQQARPLLPGSPGCVALVTSRLQLASLIAIEGAYPVTVEVLLLQRPTSCSCEGWAANASQQSPKR